MLKEEGVNLYKFIIFCLLCMFILNSVVFANSIIYKNSIESEISTGTKLREYDLLTEDGWVKAYIVEANLNDEYTGLKLLTSEEGVSKLASTMAMTKASDALAGINADFFSGRAGIGHAIGLAVEDGTIVTSSSSENKKKSQFSTLYFDKNNNPLYDFFTDEITIYCGSQKAPIKANEINKYSTDLSSPSIYTEAWGEKSIGSSETVIALEVVVQNGEVLELRENKGSVDIPKDGYIIMADGTGAEFLKENLKVGSEVSFEINYSPNVGQINFAVSGGSRLVENGVIPEKFSHVANGRNPRTAIGTSKDGKHVYLICVDGRISTSIGMTQQEFAEFILSEGIYNAINLDGGGSTTMVARIPGECDVSEVNIPSEGTERLVANGVGIVSDAPESDVISELVIKLEETNIFVGEKEKIEVYALNQYKDPVEFDSGDIKWDYDGVDVKVEDGFVSGSTVGATKLIAKLGKIKTNLEINILSEVNEIVIYPKEKVIEKGESVRYSLLGKNRNGYYASTDITTFEAKIEKYYKNNILEDIPKDAKIEDLVFSANTSGTYIISFAKGTCKSFAKVVISSNEYVPLDDFEKEDFYFDPYPDEVGGSTELSDEFAHGGKYSVKLNYDFDKDALVRGAYIVMDEPIVVPSDAVAISFWIYNEEYKEEKLKIKMLDGNGDTRIIILQDNIPQVGWNEIIYNIRNYVLPLKITDIYVAQNDENIRNKGYIYVDDFGYYNNKIVEKDIIETPKDEKLEDANNVSIKGIYSYNIAFLDSLDNSKIMMNWLKNQMMINDINNEANLVVFTNNISTKDENMFITSGDEEEFVNDSKFYIPSHNKISKSIINNKEYEIYSGDSCTIITMDISQNSIRLSDSSQFINISDDIKNDTTGNVILVLNNSIDNFVDKKERKVFVDMLCELKRNTGKNIIVVHSGFFQDYSLERGVKFLSVHNKINDVKDMSKAEYLLLSISKKEISYEYRKVF